MSDIEVYLIRTSSSPLGSRATLKSLAILVSPGTDFWNVWMSANVDFKHKMRQSEHMMQTEIFIPTESDRMIGSLVDLVGKIFIAFPYCSGVPIGAGVPGKVVVMMAD